MTTVIVVAPSYDAAHPAWGFVAKHVEALTEAFERVVVITPEAAIGGEPLAAEFLTAGGAAGGIRAAVAAAISRAHDDTVVIVLDDPSLLAQVRAEAGDRLPILWWCSQAPSAKASAFAARWADGMLVGAMPEDDTAGVPTWTVGAGTDLVTTPPPPERPPLQLLALGRTAPRKGLAVMIRAVAIARSNGVDTRLAIVGPSTNAVEMQHRQELETLVKSTALTSLVTVREAVAPAAVLETIAEAHALIDASDDEDLHLASLEAIAAGRPVLTSNRRLIRMLPSDDLSLDFEPGSASALARRIVLLSEMWPATLATIGESARASVDAAHALPLLVSQWTQAVDEVRARPRPAAAVPPSVPSTPPMVNGSLSPSANAARTVRQFLAAWADLDAEGASASFAAGALRFDGSTQAADDGTLASDYLAWVARTAEGLQSDVEELEVVEDTVVAVRTDRWTMGDDEVTISARSLFEIVDGRITSWIDTELVQGIEAIPAPAITLAEPAEVAEPAPHTVAHDPTPVASAAVIADDAQPAVADISDRVAEYEAQVHHWRRQAMIWRERAIAAKALSDAYRSNIEDLRILVDVLEEPPPPPLPESPAEEPRSEEARPEASEPEQPVTAPDADDSGTVEAEPDEPIAAHEDQDDEEIQVPTTTDPPVAIANGTAVTVPAPGPEEPVAAHDATPPVAPRQLEVERYPYSSQPKQAERGLVTRSTRFARLLSQIFWKR